MPNIERSSTETARLLAEATLLKSKRHEARTIMNALDERITELSRQIRAVCLHETPDGVSTMHGDFFGSMCEICGYNDY